MKKSLQSLVMLLMALMVPMTATAAYEQLADGVYQDGSTLYISSSVTSLGDLQVNPSEIYCYATIPPACVSNTFSGYGATLHVPAAGMVSYFTALYWYNFNNILSDAIEPLSLTMNTTEYELEIGQQLSLSATVAPSDATPKTVYWSSTDASVATVRGGGTVTAVATGECDIFARCVDKVALCHVTVVLPRVTITLDKHEARLLPNHTITLTATCSPVDVDLAVTSSNPGVAIPRIVNGTIMVVGVAEGTATITVNAADGWSNPDSCVVTVYTEPGDVNCDGYVNISDVTALIDYLLSGNPSGVNLTGADCNNDGGINISDVTTLIDYLLSGTWPWVEPETPSDSHEYVDLGLPSGTLWATCNIGANSPEEYGDYFSWGETEYKEMYNYSTYKWCRGSYDTMTKYCTNIFFGSVDNKTELEAEDDAASVNWGPSWCMPTYEQYQELINNCSWQWTTVNGINGQLVTGPNGNTLFLPSAGYYSGSMLSASGELGNYWSSSVVYGYPSYACTLSFSSGNINSDNYGRGEGLTVRAVRVSQIETFEVNGVSFKMIPVEGGTFMMGATTEQGSDAFENEKPAHQVTLSSFSIGETEVTQALWQAVMGSNPSHYADNLQRPVERVSWNVCQTFITKLNQLTGKNFRLPTEAEWEFAARGGNLSQGYKYAGSNNLDEVGWYKANSDGAPHSVATLAPNELGLYDMSGNVYEWCQDWYGSYSSEAQTNPTGPASASSRVHRSGCLLDRAEYCRVSDRGGSALTTESITLGLRLALDPEIRPTPEEHDWVDLGLPSGTLWATCNVGANSPEEYGDFFAWGETAPKDFYSWETYRWCNGCFNTLTKYNNNSNLGLVDNKTELDPEDDAAYVNWGPSWCMPTKEQRQELVDKCTWTWTKRNGVNGELVTGPNGNTLFLPAAGNRWDDSLDYAGHDGVYWSRTLHDTEPSFAYGFDFWSDNWGGNLGGNEYERFVGITVRPVRISQE